MGYTETRRDPHGKVQLVHRHGKRLLSDGAEGKSPPARPSGQPKSATLLSHLRASSSPGREDRAEAHDKKKHKLKEGALSLWICPEPKRNYAKQKSSHRKRSVLEHAELPQQDSEHFQPNAQAFARMRTCEERYDEGNVNDEQELKPKETGERGAAAVDAPYFEAPAAQTRRNKLVHVPAPLNIRRDKGKEKLKAGLVFPSPMTCEHPASMHGDVRRQNAAENVEDITTFTDFINNLCLNSPGQRHSKENSSQSVYRPIQDSRIDQTPQQAAIRHWAASIPSCHSDLESEAARWPDSVIGFQEVDTILPSDAVSHADAESSHRGGGRTRCLPVIVQPQGAVESTSPLLTGPERDENLGDEEEQFRVLGHGRGRGGLDTYEKPAKKKEKPEWKKYG